LIFRILGNMDIVTPESFLKEARDKIAFDAQLNEETSLDKPLQAIIENCMRAINALMFKVSMGMESISLEILEVNQGRPVSEQWMNEKMDIEAAHAKIDYI